MSDHDSQGIDALVPTSIRPPDKLERAAEVGVFVAEITSAAGILFPPALLVTTILGYLLGGYADGRKFQRITDVIIALNTRITTLEGATRDYAKSEEFLDLVEEVMDRAMKTRSNSKRQIYAGVLADALKHPYSPYDDKIVFLRILDDLQDDHIRIIRMYIPQVVSPTLHQSIKQGQADIENELNDVSESMVEELIRDLQSLQLLVPRGSLVRTQYEQLLTLKGERFIRFLID